MDTSRGSISRWMLAILFIFASLHQRSEAITWIKQPTKPTILVEGINNTYQSLAWEFVLDADEAVQNVLFQREEHGDVTPTTLASRLASTSFTLLNNGYVREYSAYLPNTLLLRNVSNKEEYNYTIVVNYVKNNIVQTPFRDPVEVIVYVPPKFTKEPARETEVTAGQNLMLTCNAVGDPTPNITWTKEGVSQDQFYYFGHALSLVNVKGKDVGSYICTARNDYGVATSLVTVTVKCPPNLCQVLNVGITIQSVEWKQAYSNNLSVEHKMLKSNLSLTIARLYSLPQNDEKQLFELTVLEFRPGSTIAIVELQFQKDVLDPLKPLRDDVTDGNFGTFKVAAQLNIHPISTPSAPRPTVRNAGLKSAQIWGIVGETTLFLIIRAIIV